MQVGAKSSCKVPDALFNLAPLRMHTACSSACAQVWADKLATAEDTEALCDVIRELYQQEDIPYGKFLALLRPILNYQASMQWPLYSWRSIAVRSLPRNALLTVARGIQLLWAPSGCACHVPYIFCPAKQDLGKLVSSQACQTHYAALQALGQ